MMFPYDSYLYFFDLLSLTIVLLPLHYLIRGEAGKKLLLTAAGVYLLFCIAPRLLVFYFGFWLLTWFLQNFAFSENRIRNPLSLLAPILLPLILLPMVYWKITGDNFVSTMTIVTNGILQHMSTKLWELDMARDIVPPLGLSFATFRAIDLLIKTYLGQMPRLKFREVMFYGFFPPVQITGPICEYTEVSKRQEATPDDILAALLRISAGLVKALILADWLETTSAIFIHPGDFSTGGLWLRLVGYSWYFYLNFSGYSDVAIGVAALFGYKLKENFNFPFFKPNIQEYWNSWHMSLSRWAQRNVYIAAGGYRAETQYFALFLTMMAIALWHSITISMVVFGTYHFCLLALHRLYSQKIDTQKSALPKRVAYTLMTDFFVLLGFPLVLHRLPDLLPFYAALVGR